MKLTLSNANSREILTNVFSQGIEKNHGANDLKQSQGIYPHKIIGVCSLHVVFTKTPALDGYTNQKMAKEQSTMSSKTV